MNYGQTPERNRPEDVGRIGSRPPSKAAKRLLVALPAAMLAVSLVSMVPVGGQETTVPVALKGNGSVTNQAGLSGTAISAAAKGTISPTSQAGGTGVASPAPTTVAHDAHADSGPGTEHDADCADNHSASGPDDAADCAEGADHDHDHDADHHAHSTGPEHDADCADNHSASGSEDAGDCT